ncbi:MAG: NADH-quinone oxidoreductase subunit D, partial [Fidelibacterota bacterium]
MAVNLDYELGTIRADEMVLNMGPQHPSTHGVLRLKVRTDGEIVSEITPYIGYLHRCFEKHAESITYEQVIPFTDRCDYIAAMNNNLGYCLAVEKLMDTRVPEKVEFIRVIVAELNRIASHLLSVGTFGL